jgi:hypothetical protein
LILRLGVLQKNKQKNKKQGFHRKKIYIRSGGSLKGKIAAISLWMSWNKSPWRFFLPKEYIFQEIGFLQSEKVQSCGHDTSAHGQSGVCTP